MKRVSVRDAGHATDVLAQGLEQASPPGPEDVWMGQFVDQASPGGAGDLQP
jgi:hypothetical protein